MESKILKIKRINREHIRGYYSSLLVPKYSSRWVTTSYTINGVVYYSGYYQPEYNLELKQEYKTTNCNEDLIEIETNNGFVYLIYNEEVCESLKDVNTIKVYKHLYWITSIDIGEKNHMTNEGIYGTILSTWVAVYSVIWAGFKIYDYLYD